MSFKENNTCNSRQPLPLISTFYKYSELEFSTFQIQYWRENTILSHFLGLIAHSSGYPSCPTSRIDPQLHPRPTASGIQGWARLSAEPALRVMLMHRSLRTTALGAKPLSFTGGRVFLGGLCSAESRSGSCWPHTPELETLLLTGRMQWRTVLVDLPRTRGP